MLLLLPVLLVGAVAQQPADANWSKHCTTCHGTDGKGNTTMGKKLSIKDLTDPAFQASFTDEAAGKAIREGIKSPEGKTKMKPISGLSDEEITQLVALVRRLKA
jgi:cytochrome c6